MLQRFKPEANAVARMHTHSCTHTGSYSSTCAPPTCSPARLAVRVWLPAPAGPQCGGPQAAGAHSPQPPAAGMHMWSSAAASPRLSWSEGHCRPGLQGGGRQAAQPHQGSCCLHRVPRPCRSGRGRPPAGRRLQALRSRHPMPGVAVPAWLLRFGLSKGSPQSDSACAKAVEASLHLEGSWECKIWV